MDTVRLGIVGFGGMGSHHGRYIVKGEVPNAKLAAVCDINPERLALAKQIAGDDLPVFDNADALFASGAVDAIMIATPHYFHPPIAMQAFEHGLHVLSEKPAGVYAKQVREMNAAAAKSGKIFGLMFNQRTYLSHRKMKDIVESGEIGEIRRVLYMITDWFRSQSYYNSGGWRATWAGEGGGVLVNQCPHNLDLWQWICGMPTRLRSHCQFGKFHDIEVEDAVTTYVEYANGATGSFITTTGEAPGFNRFEIVGDRGTLVLEKGNLTLYRNRVPVSQYMYETTESFTPPECWKCEVPSGGGPEHAGVTRGFVEAILNGTPLIARGEEGINGVILANAMHLSTWLDDWVELPMDEDLYYAKLQEKIATSTYKKSVTAQKAMNFSGTF